MFKNVVIHWILPWFFLFAAGCSSNGGDGPKGSATTLQKPAATRREASASPSAAGTGAQLPESAKVSPRAKGQPLRIGVTLHPYYSWTKSVVGDAPGVEVRAVLPGDVDAGDYQPTPADIAKIKDLDAIVVNGIGHDDFVGEMIRASGNDKLVILRANEGTPTVKSAHGDAPNSHTFISFTNAVQETLGIAKALSSLEPELAETFQKNAEAYAVKLRKIKAEAAEKLAHAKVKRVVTVHDGYAYLCQEFGVEVVGVVQPAHGLVPSAAELGAMSDLLKREKIQVVLTEESFPEKLLAVLKQEAPIRVYIISHIAAGEYAADEFERVMQKNVDTLVKALVTDG